LITRYYISLAALLIGFTSTAQNSSATFPDVIYPKYRVWTSPNAGETAESNPPSFQWPASKNVTYHVQLSPKSDFSGPLIEKEGIPFGMYNPHQKLTTGTWYWRYREGEGKWNNLDSFDISSSSEVFVTPTAEELFNAVPKAHPRVLAKTSDLENLRNRAKDSKESQAIIFEANSYLNIPLPNEEDALSKIEGKNSDEDEKLDKNTSKVLGWSIHKRLTLLSQAYILTGSQKYFLAAKNIMLEVATWDPKGPTHTSDFGDAGIMSGLAIAFDTFWNLLEVDERSKMIEHSAARANGFYKSWKGRVENRSSSMHVWQHIMHQMLQTSLVLIGEHEDANQWMEYIYEIWLAQSPKMAEKDGAWINGTGYFAMNTLTLYDVSSILGDLTNLDFMDTDFFKNNPTWLIYSFPPGSVSDGFGNDGDKRFPTIRYAGYTAAAAQIFKNPQADWYAQKVADYLGEEVADDEEFRWFRIKNATKTNKVKSLPALDLPQASVYRDVGVAYMHTSLQNPKNDLMLSARSSPFGPLAHTHAEQNSFNISYNGKRLFYNTGYRAAMVDPHFKGWHKHTQGHNAVLIDGKGQPFNAGAYGWMPRFLNSDEISYAVGDASNAYSGKDENQNIDLGMKKFRRHYIMLRPSTIIIYDELEADHKATWSWLLHNDIGLEINAKENQILASNEEGKAKVNLFSSSDIDFQVTDQFAIPVENWTEKTNSEGEVIDFVDQWHFSGVSKEKMEKMRYLAIFQILPNGDFEEVKSNVSNGEFSLGDWLIRAEMNIALPGRISVQKEDGSIALVSSGTLNIGGKTFGNLYDSSSKLAALKNGIYILKETEDLIPHSMQKVINMENKSKN
jgi:hypothetical protein